MDFDVDYAAVLKKALSGGGLYADIFIERSASFSLVCEDSRIEKAVSGLDAGAGVRLIFDNRTAYAYTNDISTASLLETADAVRQAARGSSSPGDIDLRRKKPRVDFTVLKAPE
ncbi:MAG TPA: DNA gyrase modulator, partial [Nitrospirota bacterium]